MVASEHLTDFGMFISMSIKPICTAGLALLLLSAPACVRAQDPVLALSPPMGWNSWDSYGISVTEEQFRQNMVVMAAQLKEFGWQYVVIDQGWYLNNPEDVDEPENLRYTLNDRGQFEPAMNRFPSSRGWLGFKPLADDVHSEGLKFGIHIFRGIPKRTFLADLRIGRTPFRASQATDPSDVCSWNQDNFGVKENAAGQAWYDALMKQYASWGVDYIKVDCIASIPYHAAEINMIHKAIVKSGRSMFLSLSPGPTPLEHAAQAAANAQSWRISEEVWDHWDQGADPSQSVKGQFGLAAAWQQYAGPGNWPDADTLPIGELSPAPALGLPRTTRLTEDEQRTMVTLWAIARSPLFLGANLTRMDGFTKSLLTDPGVIAVNQNTIENHWVGEDQAVEAWTAKSPTGPSVYLALFNLADAPRHIEKPYSYYGVEDKTYKVRDVWERRELGPRAEVSIDLPPHASVLFELKP